MADRPARRTLTWQIATIAEIRDETERAKTFRLEVPGWPGHLAGQHVDLRLTAGDGYQVERSYSIASAPGPDGVEITVERIEDGEVSPFLHDIVVPGDRIEVRGPIGGYFVWEPSMAEPTLLVAGGSGVVPLMAMVRARAAAGAATPTVLLASWRSRGEIIYFDELERLGGAGDGLRVVHTLTRSQPEGWTGYARRIDREMLTDVLVLLDGDGTTAGRQVYICGPTLLVEAAAEALVGLGLPAAAIRTERFGPSGT